MESRKDAFVSGMAILLLTSLAGCPSDKQRTTTDVQATTPATDAGRSTTAAKPDEGTTGTGARAIYCMYYDTKKYGTVGSCSSSEKECVDWSEESKHVNGGYNYTPCQSQRKVWCFRQVSTGMLVADYLNCYPSSETCEGQRVLRDEGQQLVSRDCELIEASAYLAMDERSDQKPDNWLWDDTMDACRDALSGVGFLTIPTRRPNTELFYCRATVKLDAVRAATEACGAPRIHPVVREEILRVLKEVEKNQTDVIGKYCTPERLRCSDQSTSAAQRTACLRALPWPETHRPPVSF